MKNLIVSLLVATVSILILAYLLPGVQVAGFIAALITAIVIGLINAFVKPILKLLTLPVTILTLGLFLFVLNALMIMLADYIVSGFNVDNFWWALFFSFLLSLVTSIIGSFVGEVTDR